MGSYHVFSIVGGGTFKCCSSQYEESSQIVSKGRDLLVFFNSKSQDIDLKAPLKFNPPPIVLSEVTRLNDGSNQMNPL